MVEQDLMRFVSRPSYKYLQQNLLLYMIAKKSCKIIPKCANISQNITNNSRVRVAFAKSVQQIDISSGLPVTKSL